VEGIGVEAIHAHEAKLVPRRRARVALSIRLRITLFGPIESAGIVSFDGSGVHPHDIGTILDEEGVAIRAGHHCAQPLMEHLGVPRPRGRVSVFTMTKAMSRRWCAAWNE
jgi:cysteine desulfurase/selenocysteine lyase